MDPTSYREEVYDTFADLDREPDAQIEHALDVGTEYLGLPIGFLTRIEDGTQRIVQATGSHDLIQPGETCPLEDAYCRRTVEVEGSLAVQNAATSAAVSDAAVETFDLGTYLGAKIIVDGAVYGTVCFAGGAEREEPFSESEELFIELLAKLVGGALERRNHERELRRRNERLEREKRRFEGVAENSFDVLFRVDADGTFTYVSSAVERALGYAPDDLVGAPVTGYVTPKSVEDATAALVRIFDGETVENLELVFLDADGEAVTLEVNATPITDDGEVVGAQGVGRDVTDRKERERELRLKNRAMDEARIGISIADNGQPDRPLVYVNGGFERVTGYDAEAVLGRNCRFLQGEATDPETVDRLRENIEADEPVAVEILNYRRDGTPFWNQLRISPVEDDAGEITHHLGFQADVTERKRTEQLVRLLNRVLRHNLRNDMNVLLGFGDLLAEGEVDDVERVGERIRDTAADLVDLGEQARDLERHAGQEREPRRIDVESVLNDVVDDHRDRTPGATVDLTVETERGVCAGTEIERALSELVGNALKHGDADGARVEVEAVDDGEWVEITVADDGPGIDGMESAAVASGEESRIEHGAGFGLWLVNWIVTRYGGSFQIRAVEGDDGSVATVRLPGVGPDTTVEDAARPPTVLFR
jgi:PAS domain S-box-containing protein